MWVRTGFANSLALIGTNMRKKRRTSLKTEHCYMARKRTQSKVAIVTQVI